MDGGTSAEAATEDVRPTAQEDEFAARRKAAQGAARAAGDVVRVDGSSWSLAATVKPGTPALQFEVRGDVREGEEGEVMVSAPGKVATGPVFLTVRRDRRVVQRLQRRAPGANPLDLNSMVDVEPLRLFTLPEREGGNLSAGSLELSDANFDGTLDLHVTVGMAHKCPIVQHFLYQPARGSFVENAQLGQINCVQWDSGRKLVISREWSCCEEWISVFHWEGSRLVLDREIWRERGEGGAAKVTYHEVVNGKPVTREEVTVSEKAVP